MSRLRPGCLLLCVLALGFGGGATRAGAAPSDDNQMIVPQHAGPKATAPADGSSLPGPFTAVAVLVLAGVGGWLVWRGRAGGVGSFSRASRQLTVEETRSLGGRQYLVIAAYRDKKFLLGVCPGRIDMLAALHESAPDPEKPKA